MRKYIETYMADDTTKFADKMFDKALVGYDFNGQVYYDHHKMRVIPCSCHLHQPRLHQ